MRTKMFMMFMMCMAVMVVAVGGFFVGCGGNKQEFCYESLTISLTREASEVAIANNHIFTVNDFPEVALAEIVTRWDWSGPYIGLVLRLKNPGRQNVLNAIEVLQQRDDVLSAGVNGFDLAT